jgi:hypothetical protein
MAQNSLVGVAAQGAAMGVFEQGHGARIDVQAGCLTKGDAVAREIAKRREEIVKRKKEQMERVKKGAKKPLNTGKVNNLIEL